VFSLSNGRVIVGSIFMQSFVQLSELVGCREDVGLIIQVPFFFFCLFAFN